VAESALGERVSRAVISVPAHFTDVQRRSTKLAAEYAGLEVVRLINEPTAAAFAYGYRKGENFTLAVYDLGGGTFDITIMTAKGDTFEVDATDGDSFLGGEDFDGAIADWLKQEFLAEFNHDLSGDAGACLRLQEAAERAKVELSELDSTRIELPFLAELPNGGRPHLARDLTREKLAELARPLLERSLELCERCVQEAGLVKQDIDEVLLVGGQTRMVLIREGVRDFFGREPRRDINPDEVVAMGAALYGYSLQAEDLKEDAEEAAAEACSVAMRGADVARKMLDQVEEVVDVSVAMLDDRALAARLQALLDQTDAEDPPTPRYEHSNLPDSVSRVSEDLCEIERRADEVARHVQSRRNIPTEKAEAMVEQLEEFVDRARVAATQAQEHVQEAQEHEQARKVNLVDVTSHALGIASAGDVFSILITKNTPIPVEMRRVFTTHQDGQTEVEVSVYQGQKRYASKNQRLGDFVLEGIPPMPRMHPKVDVAFKIDEDGILAVRAQDLQSGSEQAIRIEDSLGLQPREDEELDELGDAAAPDTASSMSALDLDLDDLD
jgi:molecular chaperone DnaK (HSP70)